MRKGAVHGIGRGWIFQPGDAVSPSSVLAFPNASIKAVGLVWAVVVVVLCVRSVWAVVDVVLDVSLSLAVVGVGLFVGLVRAGVDFDLGDMSLPGCTCQVSTNGLEGGYTLFLRGLENLVFVPETKEILYIPTPDLGK